MPRPLLFLLIILLLFAPVTTFAEVQPLEGTHALRNKESGQYLRPRGASSAEQTPMVMFQPVAWKCVTWEFQQLSGRQYQLKNLYTGKTFGAIAVDQTAVQQSMAEDQPTQAWEFIHLGGGDYQIRSKATGLYLQPVSSEPDAPVKLAAASDVALQRWQLVAQRPTH